MRDFSFNDIRASSKGMTVDSIDIGYPTVRTSEITVPYRDSVIDSYDLNGMKVYEDRTLTVKMWKKCSDRAEVERIKHDIADWLYPPAARRKFIDSAMPDYYFLAKISSFDASASTRKACIITVTSKADPYMYSSKEGVKKTI